MKPNYLENIPKNWEVKKLKYLFEFKKGKNPKETVLDNKDLPIYLSMDYLRGKPKTTFYVKDIEKCLLVKKNDVLLLWDGSNAGEFIQAKDGVLSSTMAVLKARLSIDEKFTWFLLKDFELVLKQQTIGMGIPHVNPDFLYNYQLLLPPLPTQQKIAHFLDQKTSEIDTLIHKKNKLIKLLQEEEKAFINEKITKGTNEVYPMKNSGIEWIGKIPKHWKISRMKNICKVRQGLQIPIDKRYLFKDNDSLEYITIRSINNPKQAKEYIKNPPKNVICNKDDILMARTGATGEVIINVAGVFHNNFFLVDYNRFIIDKMFLYYFLKSSLIKEHLLMVAGVTTIPDLNHKDFYNTPFFQFSLDEQNKIVEEIETHIDKNRQVVKKLSKEVDLLKEYRQSLISEAVTGQLVI